MYSISKYTYKFLILLLDMNLQHSHKLFPILPPWQLNQKQADIHSQSSRRSGTGEKNISLCN